MVGRLLTNSPIGQPLAGDALKRQIGAVSVAVAERTAGVVAEVEFAHVALQVLFSDMMERADQTALEDREIAFHGVRRDVAACVFLRCVVHEFMAGVALRGLSIGVMAIGVNVRVLVHVLGDGLFQRGRRDHLDMERAHLAAALDQRHDLFLLMSALLRADQLADLGLVRVAPVGFINFDRRATAAEQAA